MLAGGLSPASEELEGLVAIVEEVIEEATASFFDVGGGLVESEREVGHEGGEFIGVVVGRGARGW